ncbi:MAG: CoA ester lyase [Acidimicrobiales bacterium]|jgi:citrate lyase subunit beta / citryl-CoA lyase
MSQRSRSLPRRSCLSTPGSSERFLAKAPVSVADFSFLDLEDSVAPSEKVGARDKVVRAIRDLHWDDRVLCVRINGWESPWTYGDVLEVVGHAGERLDEVMLPKVRRASDVVALDLLLSQVEVNVGLPPGHVGIDAQIETAEGLINVEEICGASSRLESIVFGPADFAASIGMPVTTIDDTIHDAPSNPFSYAFAKILVAGRANGLHVIDGPYLKVRDLVGLKRAASISASYGFDGKWALTPDQAIVLNDVYSPSQELFDKSYDILDAYRIATLETSSGAVMFGDEMIDEASAKIAESFVARGLRAGLTRST